MQISVLDAPSILGLRPTGVELLPQALREAGLVEKLGAHHAGIVPTIGHVRRRDPVTQLLNPNGLREFSLVLADHVGSVLEAGQFPVVLGGDCSIIIGTMLALKRRGPHGLFFLDGHGDFYQPEVSPTGEAADSDLAIVTGRGPEIVANIENSSPLVRDEHVVVFGMRDYEQAIADGCQDIMQTGMQVYDLNKIREMRAEQAAAFAIQKMLFEGAQGFWIHLDVDVLHDDCMPAVDYRMPGGLIYDELVEVLRIAFESGAARGMSISIFNPTLDPDGSIARALVDAIAAGFNNAQTALPLEAL